MMESATPYLSCITLLLIKQGDWFPSTRDHHDLIIGKVMEDCHNREEHCRCKIFVNSLLSPLRFTVHEQDHSIPTEVIIKELSESHLTEAGPDELQMTEDYFKSAIRR